MVTILDTTTSKRRGKWVSWLEVGDYTGLTTMAENADEHNYAWRQHLDETYTGLDILRIEQPKDDQVVEYRWHIHVPSLFQQAISRCEMFSDGRIRRNILYYGVTKHYFSHNWVALGKGSPPHRRVVKTLNLMTYPKRQDQRNWMEIGSMQRTRRFFGDEYFSPEATLSESYPGLTIFQLPEGNEQEDPEQYRIRWHIDVLAGFAQVIARCEFAIPHGQKMSILYKP